MIASSLLLVGSVFPLYRSTDLQIYKSAPLFLPDALLAKRAYDCVHTLKCDLLTRHRTWIDEMYSSDIISRYERIRPSGGIERSLHFIRFAHSSRDDSM